MTPFQTFAPELRKLGFRKDWSSRAGGCRVDEWSKRQDEPATNGVRKITVQLWDDGQHRASHDVDGVGSTLPTDFSTIAELRIAVDREAARMDNKKVCATIAALNGTAA